MMGAPEIVKLHEATQAALQRKPTGEVVAPEDHAPMFGEDRLLQALDEAVGPGVPRLNARVLNAKGPAGGVELASELTPPSVNTRRSVQPACVTAGTTTWRRKRATAAADCSGRIRATP